jgi:AcrR family transcriptional regulator
LASETAVRPSEQLALPAQQTRSRRTRERLLAAAEQVFAEKGYEGARLVDIAEVAGCSVGTVYFRFKDKDALFQAIAEDFAHNARRMMPYIIQETTPRDILRNSVHRLAANYRLHRGLFRAIIERGFGQPHLTAEIFKLRDEAAQNVERALRQGGLEGDDLGFKVRIAMQMLQGFMLTATLNPLASASIDDKRSIDELADACILYLGA